MWYTKKNDILEVHSQINGEVSTQVLSQPAFTCSKSIMERPEQCVKSVQSLTSKCGLSYNFYIDAEFKFALVQNI